MKGPRRRDLLKIDRESFLPVARGENCDTVEGHEKSCAASIWPEPSSNVSSEIEAQQRNGPWVIIRLCDYYSTHAAVPGGITHLDKIVGRCEKTLNAGGCEGRTSCATSHENSWVVLSALKCGIGIVLIWSASFRTSSTSCPPVSVQGGCTPRRFRWSWIASCLEGIPCSEPPPSWGSNLRHRNTVKSGGDGGWTAESNGKWQSLPAERKAIARITLLCLWLPAPLSWVLTKVL